MHTYVVRWPNDEVVLAQASSKQSLMMMLDSVEDPSACDIKELPAGRGFAVSFRSAARWKSHPERAPRAAKKIIQQRCGVDPEPRLGAGLLSDNLGAAWRAGKLDCTADLRLRSEGGDEFLANRSILACRSDFLQTTFANQASFSALPRSEAEDNLPVLALEAASHTIEAFLELVYTDRVPAALLPAARRDRGFYPRSSDDDGGLSSLERSDRLLRLLLFADQLMAPSLKRALESVVSRSLSLVAGELLSSSEKRSEDEVSAVADLLIGAAGSCVSIGMDALFNRAVALLAKHQAAIPPSKLRGLDERIGAALRKLAASNPPASCGLVPLPYSVPVAMSTQMGWVDVLESLVDQDVREAAGSPKEAPGSRMGDAGGDARAAASAAVSERRQKAADAKFHAAEAAAAAGVTEAQAAAAESQKAAGNVAFKSAQYASAAELYTAAIELNPHRVEYFTNRALARLRLAPPAPVDALEDAERALSLDPLSWKAHARKSAALRALGRERDAIWALVVGMDVAADPTDAFKLERLLKDEVRAQSFAVAKHEFLANNAVGDVSGFLEAPDTMVPLQLVTLSEFPDENGEHGALQKAIDGLVFPRAAELADAAVTQSYNLYGGGEEEEEGAIGEAELRDAFVSDCVAKRANTIEGESLRYFSWLRGDKMAGLELTGQSFAAQQAAAGVGPANPMDMFRYAGLAQGMAGPPF